MKIKGILILTLSIFCAFYADYSALAQYSTTAAPQGRYELITLNNTAISARSLPRKAPAIILDTYLGIVWRCQDLQDEKPLWIKTDLAKNLAQQVSQKKYTVQIPLYSGYELKIPAIVLDTEEGKVWTCSDITSESANWIEKDLPSEKKENINTKFNMY